MFVCAVVYDVMNYYDHIEHRAAFIASHVSTVTAMSHSTHRCWSPKCQQHAASTAASLPAAAAAASMTKMMLMVFHVTAMIDVPQSTRASPQQRQHQQQH